jgi:hypothetical protein
MDKGHAKDHDVAIEVGGHEAIVCRAYKDGKNV